MKKLMYACDEQILKSKTKFSRKFRKADGGVFTMVLGAAIGALVLIGFYLVAKQGLTTWGDSFQALVTM